MQRMAWVLLLCCGGAQSTAAQGTANWHPNTLWSSSSFHCPGDVDKTRLQEAARSGDIKAEDTAGSAQVYSCPGWEDASNLEYLKHAADAGYQHAQLTLGEAYRDAKGTPKDDKAAADWFAQAVKSGDAKAENNLGVSYALGAGVVKNEGAAAKLYLDAAEKGLPEAQYNLATLLDEGKGTPQDYKAARDWYAKAAERGIGDAAYRLALLNEQGLGGAKNNEAAHKWLEKAAENGSEDAQVRLGQKQASVATSVNSGYFQYMAAMAMVQGKEVKKDEATAIKFLEKAAEAGYPPAMDQLGDMYTNGQGTSKDEKKAEQYYLQAIATDGKYAAPYNELAWLYVTTTDAKLHNAKRALELGKAAVELSQLKDAAFLDTLAHAFFELGDLTQAVENEGLATDLDPKNQFIQKTLAEYKAAKIAGRP